METEQEWQAVKNLIQTRTNKFNDDWHIGLYMNGTDGNWTWVSGKPLLIDRWQPWQPRDGASFVVMAKNYPPGTRGLFNDVREDIFAGFVCEQSSGELSCSFDVTSGHSRVESFLIYVCDWRFQILRSLRVFKCS